MSASCLFNSLASFHREDGEVWRGKICAWLSRNPVLMDNLTVSQITEALGTSLKAYVRKMSLPSTMGSAIEIKAYCDMTNEDVRVYLKPEKRNTYFFCAGGNPKAVRNLVWTGNHYDPSPRPLAPDAPDAASYTLPPTYKTPDFVEFVTETFKPSHCCVKRKK